MKPEDMDKGAAMAAGAAVGCGRLVFYLGAAFAIIVFFMMLDNPPPQSKLTNVLCGCGWGELNRLVEDGEIITCPLCGTELGHE